MPLYVLMSLIFVTVSLVTLFVILLLGGRSNLVVRRLANGTGMGGVREELTEVVIGSPFSRKKGKSKVEKVIFSLGRLARRDELKVSKTRLSLMRAGYYRDNAVRVFMSLKVLGAISMSMFYVALLIVGDGRTSPVLMAGMLGFLAMVGYTLPDFILSSKTRRRQEEIASSLPDTLDFLVVCIEAGIGLNAALIRVGDEMRLKSKALSEELLLVNQEMRAGVTREKALRHLAKRNEVKDLNILVSSIILAERLGTNITDTLRAQSDSLRIRVRQRAEERAARAAVKMLFPLVFLILPALFIVILGPGLILTLKSLG